MKNILLVIQIIIAISLTILIFFQSGGEDESKNNILSTSTFEKRGWEKVMFELTIVMMILFLVSSIIQTLI